MNFFNGNNPFGGQAQMTPRPGGNPSPYGVNRGASMPRPQYGVNQGPLAQLRGSQPTGSLPEALGRIQGGLAAGRPMQPAAPQGLGLMQGSGAGVPAPQMQQQQTQPMDPRATIASLLMRGG